MIPRDFNTVTFQQSLEVLVPVAAGDKSLAAEARLFFEGDHWQGSRGWCGSQLDNVTSDLALLSKPIEKQFCPKNVIREIVERHTAGVIGREPDWGMTPARPMEQDEEPNEAEQPLIDEAEAAQTEWGDERALHETFQKAAQQQLNEGASVLRAFVPLGFLQKDPVAGAFVVPVGTLVESFSRIYVEVPLPGSAAVYEHPSTRKKLGVFRYKELQDSGQEEDRIELTYLDEKRQTVFRILNQAGTVDRFELDLGGRLPLVALEDAPLVTRPIVQNQRNLNRTLTMMGHNAELAGFSERTLFNAQLQGTFVDDPAVSGGRRFVPDPLLLGPGITNNFVGIEQRDPQTGKITHATPGVIYRDPADPDTFLKTMAGYYRNILEEAEQTHALIAGDATATGESRKQAREGFETRLRRTKTKLDRAGRAILEVVLAMAAAFSNQTGRFAGLRAYFECRIDAGSQSLDEQRQVVEAFSAGLLSIETAMNRIGVENTDKELQKIAAEREAEIGAGRARAELATEDEEDADEQDEPPAEDDEAAA